MCVIRRQLLFWKVIKDTWYYWYLQNALVPAKFQRYLRVSDISSFSQLVENEERIKGRTEKLFGAETKSWACQLHQKLLRIWNGKTITSPSPGSHPSQVLPVRSQWGHKPLLCHCMSGYHFSTVWKHRSPAARTFTGGLREVGKVTFGLVNLWPKRPLNVTRQDRGAAPESQCTAFQAAF